MPHSYIVQPEVAFVSSVHDIFQRIYPIYNWVPNMHYLFEKWNLKITSF